MIEHTQRMAIGAISPRAFKLALQSKIFGSKTTARVIARLMRVVDISSYDHEFPLAGLLQDAMATRCSTATIWVCLRP